MPEISDAIILVSIALTTSAIAFALINWGSRTGLRAVQAKAWDDSTRFLFEDQTLMDASESAESLLENTAFAVTDWQQVVGLMRPRFPDFPDAPPKTKSAPPIVLNSIDLGEQSQVIIERVAKLTRVRLVEKQLSRHRSVADLHRQRVWERRLETLRVAVQNSPYPIWQTGSNGQIVWTNLAYDMLTRACRARQHQSTKPLFDIKLNGSMAPLRRRESVTLGDRSEKIWYDVTTVCVGSCRMHYATDINAVVEAEQAQKNFIQTLTKTFAHLSIGLAVFNRKGELMLFNPALTELTGLKPQFLSARPSMYAFFDGLRDNRTMPEPKDYNSWREALKDLITAAADGRYQETWHLPAGLIYRIVGRPHPDGAIAFLIEDISAEVSLSRRFHADLELNQSVLNALAPPIVVFSARGMLSFCNTAYRDLWQTGPDDGLTEHSVFDCAKSWCAQSMKTFQWDAVAKFAMGGPSDPLTTAPVKLRQGGWVSAKATRVSGGATMVEFTPLVREKTPAPHRADSCKQKQPLL